MMTRRWTSRLRQRHSNPFESEDFETNEHMWEVQPHALLGFRRRATRWHAGSGIPTTLGTWGTVKVVNRRRTKSENASVDFTDAD